MPDNHRVLLSGFQPFGGWDYNPALDLVEEITRRAENRSLICQTEHEDVNLTAVQLPVEFGRASELLKGAIAVHSPNLVICVGLAAGTETIRLERVGLNLRDARIPDNAGFQPAGEPIVEGGPEALFSTLRLKAASGRIAPAGIPVDLSLSAGSYVCNDLLYTLLHHMRAASPGITKPDMRGGFVHIPDLRDENTPVTLRQAAEAVDLLIAESLRPGPDHSVPAGTLH